VATILTIETPTLGDRSYVVHDGDVAFVVDPQRDIDRVLALAERERVRITDVFETHIHNDYVTGGHALARHTGAAYHVGADDDVTFERVPIRDGDVVRVGTMTVRAVATPGHTYTHLSYVLERDEPAVFSGGSLLFGSTGRPDLLGREHAAELARLQHQSVRRLAALPDETRVMPTHGFGSFCSATQTEGTSSTIGREKVANTALTRSVDEFVAETLAGLDAFPAYYAHMGPANAAGPAAPDLSAPRRAHKADIRRALDAGEWVVDLRTRTAFAAGHVPGSFSFALDGQFATYLGWMIPWGTPLTLLGESAAQVAEAQRELVRIGIDRPEAAASGDPREWTDEDLATVRRARFGDLSQVLHHRPVHILDVRRVSEYADSHIAGAVNIPLHELLPRLGEVPRGEVWVHCATGYRALVATSFLLANGYPAVYVDDGYDPGVRAAGLEVVRAG